jgi:hypothetical protein
MFLMAAMICGEEPVRTWDRSSSKVTSRRGVRGFSSPVAAVKGEDAGGVGLAGGEAGDAVDGFVAFAQWVAV